MSSPKEEAPSCFRGTAGEWCRKEPTKVPLIGSVSIWNLPRSEGSGVVRLLLHPALESQGQPGRDKRSRRARPGRREAAQSLPQAAGVPARDGRDGRKRSGLWL